MEISLRNVEPDHPLKVFYKPLYPVAGEMDESSELVQARSKVHL